MGTWGFKPFENDAACDFADAFESGGWKSVESTINRRLTRDDSDNQRVIAACEFVALANGHPRRGGKEICDGLTEWLEENPGFRPTIKLSHKAASRSRMIATKSELLDVWVETGEQNVWMRTIENLISRLEKPAKPATKKAGKKRQTNNADRGSKKPTITEAKKACKKYGLTLARDGRRIVGLDRLPSLADAQLIVGIDKVNVFELEDDKNDGEVPANVTEDQINGLRVMLAKWTMLDYVIIADVLQISECALEMEKLQMLDALRLKRCEIGSKLAGSFTKLKKLRMLKLENCGLNELIKAMAKLRNLKDLTLNECGLTIRQANQVFQHGTRIEELCIQEPGMPLTSFKRVVELKKLKALDIRCKQPTTRSAKSLIQSHPKLELEEVSHNWVRFRSKDFSE